MAVGDRIGIADKETLDKTKNNTDNIIQNTNFIKEQFPLNINGGTDWSKYSIVQFNQVTKGAPERGNLIEIKGEGYLTLLHVHIQDKNSYGNPYHISGKLIIDIDGFNKFEYDVSPRKVPEFTISIGNPSIEDPLENFMANNYNWDNNHQILSFKFPTPLFFNNLKVYIDLTGEDSRFADVTYKFQGGIK